MSPAFPDGTTWPYSPPPEKARPELGGDGDPGTYEADAGYNVPDDVIERLAASMNCPAKDGANCTACHANARKVVAHLRAHPEDAAAVLGGEVVRTEGRVWGSTDEGCAPQWHEASEDFARRCRHARPAQIRTVVVGPWREVTS